MEVKIILRGIENLKTTTGIKEEKDKDGEVVDRKLITKIQFEAEVVPQDLSSVHRLLASDTPVYVCIGSPQAVMELETKQAAVA